MIGSAFRRQSLRAPVRVRPASPPVHETPPAAAVPSLATYCERTTTFRLERWQQVICEALEPIARGERTGVRLLIHGPPQFGKSVIISQRFPSYALGINPLARIRVACYNVSHAERFSKVNLALMQSPDYAHMFADPRARVAARASYQEWSTAARAAMLDANPSFKPLGLGTGFTGLGVDILVVDDPYKNRTDAHSEAINASLWGWWTDVVIPRLNPRTNVVVMFHRWWEGDFAGRLLEHGGWDLLRFPAIADGGPDDPTGRAVGELLSSRYPREYLERVRRAQGESFDALYQGVPVPASGAMFKRGRVAMVDRGPAHGQRVRRWDIAATDGGGDYTVGVLMCREHPGIYYVEDVVRGQWDTDARDAIIRATAQADRQRYGHVTIVGPQDPGAAGKDAARAFVRNLAGFRVETERESGDKIVRADPFASQWNAGNVRLVRAAWNDAYLREMHSFPRGKHDDQVDASSGCFNRLASSIGFAHSYDLRLELPPASERHGPPRPALMRARGPCTDESACV